MKRCNLQLVRAVLLVVLSWGLGPLWAAALEIPRETKAESQQRHQRVAQRRQGIAVIAHRGSVEFAHENTLEAYRATFELGGDGNEIDIWATRDGVLVCFHDFSLDVLLHAYGEVGDYHWEELRRFPFRTPGRFGIHCRIPTLVEVLQLHRQYGGLLHLDIKQPGLDKAIAELLDRLDMWDHVAYCPSQPELGGVILKDPRLKLRRYKTALYGNRQDLASPEVIADILKRKGDDVIVDDPRGAIVALGRKLGQVSATPVAPLADLPAPILARPAPAAELLRTLSDADDGPRLATSAAGPERARQRIRARAQAAEQLLAAKVKSPRAFAVLEERVRQRSRHQDWKHHGLDGIMALQALIGLQAPNAVELARSTLWRSDPHLPRMWRDDPFLRLHGDQEIWFEFHLKRSIFPALAKLPGVQTAKLCHDFLDMNEEKAKKFVPVLFEQAAETLLTLQPTTATALELMNHRRGWVRGRAILHCLAKADQQWALTALKKGAPHALAYVVSLPGQAEAQDRSLVNTLVAQEKALFEAWKKGDLHTVKNALPDDYLEVNPFFGRMNKTQLLKDLYPHLLISKFTITDAQVMQPSKDTALLTYRLTLEGKFKDKDASGRSLISSLYVSRGNHWVLVFVQMTDLPAAQTGRAEPAQERQGTGGTLAISRSIFPLP